MSWGQPFELRSHSGQRIPNSCTKGPSAHLLYTMSALNPAGYVEIDRLISDSANSVNPADYDGLFIAGGMGPDEIRIIPEVQQFVRDYAATGKPIGVICHGPLLLSEVDLVSGRNLTGWFSTWKELKLNGALLPGVYDDYIRVDTTKRPYIVSGGDPRQLEHVSQQLGKWMVADSTSGISTTNAPLESE